MGGEDALAHFAYLGSLSMGSLGVYLLGVLVCMVDLWWIGGCLERRRDCSNSRAVLFCTRKSQC